ncbi:MULTISPECIES: stage III sporulation protein AD [Lutispora]|uniref:Stage III sporulation protein AD n=1 Tax=Lutispora saccharofermentans TaxID=3024236 RepID=A0ABT1NHM9_9FIRM|nr:MULTISPECIES: stage III sporulation protein AD [Lutispora]MCQ1529821.1 stage III sporulation protein AD [Lutispora saccharofermentans]MEA4963886.1 stage III sporulation protein AD [Lutispora sp.]HCJ57073.1 stage III sporulation protein AD [Clostridiaceae bacterium]
MNIMQIVALGIVAAILAIVLKEYRPELAMQVSIAAGLIIFISMLSKFTQVLEVLKSYAVKAEVDILYFSIILKVIGIAYITEFGAQVCRDSGEGSIASKIEFAGKVLIMAIAVPIYAALFDIIIKIMP